MFSKELENLIQATLEDGILEGNEKAALVKRAQAEGVDLAELEIYINSLLQKRQRELNEKKNAEHSALEKQKKQEYGKVCPACGRQVRSLALNCECGYEFKTERRESSVKSLSDKLSKETNKKQFEQILTLFPVPNTKEDIMEFLALATPNCKMEGGLWGTTKGRLMILVPAALLVIILVTIFLGQVIGGKEGSFGAIFFGCCCAFWVIYGGLNSNDELLDKNDRCKVWRKKFDQVLMKGRSLRGDAEFSQMLDYYENQVNKK